MALLAFLGTALLAQAPDTAVDLSTLDLDELARVKVTSAARRPETLGQSSAAITLISWEDAEHAVVRHGVLEEGIAFLSKPFDLGELARTVRGVLDKAPVPGSLS